MKYWWRRALNVATSWLRLIPVLKHIDKKTRKYSIHYCMDCPRHWPFHGKGKLVSKDHRYKKVEHNRHITRSFGWRGKPKNKYLKAIPVYKYTGPPTPEEFSLEEFIEETGDQQDEGSCGGWGDRDTTAIDTKVRKGKYPKDGWSWRCAYNGGRAIEGRLREEGVFLKDVATYRIQKGLCTYATWPSKAWEPDVGGRSWYADPSIVVHPDDLKKGQVRGIQLITTMADLDGAIYTRHAIYIGIDWDDAWMRVIGITMPAATGDTVGGHSVAILAYSRKTGRVRLQNSWTKLWGKGGLGDMLRSDLEDRMRSGEFILYIYDTEPDPDGPEPNPDPDDWLDKLQKLFEDFMKALTDLFRSMPKKRKKRKARR